MTLNFRNYVRSEKWEVDPHSLEIGPSLLGTSQIVATLADKWGATINVRVKHTEVSAFRAWKTLRRGRLIVDQMGPARKLAGSADGVIFGQSVLHSDGTAHSDGSGYGQGYVSTAAVAVRATRIAITALGVTGQFAVGKFFGVGNRLYQITALGGTSSTEAMVDFWPPLRAAVAAGDSFDWPPQTDMQLVEDDIGEIGDNATGAIDVKLILVEKP